MTIQAGKLRHKLIVEAATETRDAEGGVSKNWSTFATVYGGFISTTGREFMLAQQLNADLTHIVQMRYLVGLTPKHRFNYGGRILNILMISNINERNREMRVQCRESA